MSGLTTGSLPELNSGAASFRHPPRSATQESRPASQETREFATVDSDGTTFVAALRQRLRRAKAVRELKRLIRSAPTATIRNDLMTIAARNERFS